MFTSETAADTRYDLGHQDVFSSGNMYIRYNKLWFVTYPYT